MMGISSFFCPVYSSDHASLRPSDERGLVRRLERTLEKAGEIARKPAAKLLASRTLEWLNHSASTDEMPPIAPPDEDEGNGADEN